MLRFSAREILSPDTFMKEVFKLKIPHSTEMEIINCQYQLVVENKKIRALSQLIEDLECNSDFKNADIFIKAWCDSKANRNKRIFKSTSMLPDHQCLITVVYCLQNSPVCNMEV